VDAVKSTLAKLGDEIANLVQRLFEIAPDAQAGKTTSFDS